MAWPRNSFPCVPRSLTPLCSTASKMRASSQAWSHAKVRRLLETAASPLPRVPEKSTSRSASFPSSLKTGPMLAVSVRQAQETSYHPIHSATWRKSKMKQTTSLWTAESRSYPETWAKKRLWEARRPETTPTPCTTIVSRWRASKSLKKRKRVHIFRRIRSTQPSHRPPNSR